MKLGAKISIPLFALALATAFVAVCAVWLQRQTAELNARAAGAAAKAIEASEVRALSRAIQRDGLKLTIEIWADDRQKLAGSAESRSKQLLDRANKLAGLLGSEETEMTHDFVALQQSVVHELSEARAAALAGKIDAARDLLKNRVQPAERAASKLTDAFIEATEKQAGDLAARSRRMEASAELVLLAIAGLSLIVGVGAAVFVSRRSVVLPLRRIVAATVGLARGDLDSTVEGAERADEIGDLAKALVVFRTAASENARLQSEAEGRRAESERQRQRNEAAQRQAIDEERSIVARSVGVGLSKLAEKDLGHRLSVDIPDAYRQLQGNFNAAMAQLAEALSDVAGSADAIEAGARDVSTAAGDLAERTERQASSLEETASSVTEVTEAVRKSAEGTRQARAAVAAADVNAKESAEVVTRAVAAMHIIAKSSGEIGQIIGVIDEIAFQTNLLALNAGVEAARAGDAGRGFAVVASEVRALAQRSAEAAKEIKQIVTNSGAQVENGVALVAQTGSSLERIKEQVSEINGFVAGIAAGAEEQATALQQINTAIEEMNAFTQQNAAMVEETTAASRSLSEESARMVRLVSQFRLDARERESRREAA